MPQKTTAARRRLITISAAAEVLGVDHKTIRRLISRGELPGYRIGGTRAIRVEANDVDRLVRRIPAAG